MKNLYKIEDELYIISNTENISENCWIITEGRLVQVSYLLSNEVAKGNKVILTTNKLLIKDGVQAIPDDFLEWFVKNPSCEEVKINHERVLWEDGKITHYTYKIIIPKEEPIIKCELCKMYPRLEGTNKCESCYSVVRQVLEQDPRFKDNLLPDLRKEQETSSVGAENQIFKIVLDEKWISNKVSIIEADNNSVLNKQETLEEAAEKFYPAYPDGVVTSEIYALREGFVKGCKVQQKRSYSEEELIILLKKFKKDIINSTELDDDFETLVCDIKTNKWFEQFKKK